MNQEEWHKRYIAHLQKRGGLTRTEAEDTLKAGTGEHDYNDDPEDAANEEMSYWANDG